MLGPTVSLQLWLRPEQFIALSTVEGHHGFDLRRRPAASRLSWFPAQRPEGFPCGGVGGQSVSLQVCRGFELGLTSLVVTLVDVHMALLHVDLSLDKIIETLPTKVTGLAGGHFGPI